MSDSIGNGGVSRNGRYIPLQKEVEKSLIDKGLSETDGVVKNLLNNHPAD